MDDGKIFLWFKDKRHWQSWIALVKLGRISDGLEGVSKKVRRVIVGSYRGLGE